MSLPLEPTGLPAREDMGNVSRPAEGMEPDPLLGSQETQTERNGVTRVGTTPAQSGSRCTTGAAGLLARLRPWARRWAVPSLVLNLILILLLIFILITIIVLTTQPAPAQTCELCLAGAPCPDDWIRYRGKCYYFSEPEANWTDSQKNCSALGASLAGIDSQLEMDFMKRYKYPNSRYWIGLRQELGQWKWANGTEFNDWFPIAGGEHCAFLNDGNMASSSCSGRTHWICSKLAQKAEGGAN